MGSVLGGCTWSRQWFRKHGILVYLCLSLLSLFGVSKQEQMDFNLTREHPLAFYLQKLGMFEEEEFFALLTVTPRVNHTVETGYKLTN